MLLLSAVHRIYHQQFRRWFGIMAPASLLGGIILLLADQRVRAIFNGIPGNGLAIHFLDIFAAGAIRFGGFFLSWLLGAFALAAVATAVNELDHEDEGASWRRDSYQRARERFGSILLIAVTSFAAFLLGVVAFGFVEAAAYKILGHSRFLHYSYALSLTVYVCVASLVSWLGASIPLTLAGDTAWIALKRSVELSSGYEGALLLLVIESVVGSLFAWYLVVHGLSYLLPPVLIYSSWYGWVLNIVAVLASAATEPPLFIGFALLANSDRLQTPNVVTVAQVSDF